MEMLELLVNKLSVDANARALVPREQSNTLEDLVSAPNALHKLAEARFCGN